MTIPNRANRAACARRRREGPAKDWQPDASPPGRKWENNKWRVKVEWRRGAPREESGPAVDAE